MDKVLVKQAISAQYPVGAGAPVMVLGGGGGNRTRGRTLRERAGGALGGLVGVAGALTGQHRSLGGLTQSMISGGAQGRQLGSALGRKFVGREGQSRADMREEMTDKYARARASGEFDKYGISAEKTPFTNIGVRLTEQGGDSMMGRRLAELQRAKEAEERINNLRQKREEAYASAYGGKMGAEDKADIESMRNLRQMFDGGDPFETARKVRVVQSGSQGTPPPADFEFTPPTPLQLGQSPIPASNQDLTATGELNHPISPDQIDGDTENEPSDNMPPTPQSNNPSQLTPSNQVAVQNMNNLQQIESAKQKVKDREEMME